MNNHLNPVHHAAPDDFPRQVPLALAPLTSGPTAAVGTLRFGFGTSEVRRDYWADCCPGLLGGERLGFELGLDGPTLGARGPQLRGSPPGYPFHRALVEALT